MKDGRENTRQAVPSGRAPVRTPGQSSSRRRPSKVKVCSSPSSAESNASLASSVAGKDGQEPGAPERGVAPKLTSSSLARPAVAGRPTRGPQAKPRASEAPRPAPMIPMPAERDGEQGGAGKSTGRPIVDCEG